MNSKKRKIESIEDPELNLFYTLVSKNSDEWIIKLKEFMKVYFQTECKTDSLLFQVVAQLQFIIIYSQSNDDFLNFTSKLETRR